MNIRERVEDIADFAEGDPRGDGLVALSKVDAAALRELDKLIDDMQILARQKLRGEDVSNWEDMLQFWYERAAQAGYGEK